MKNRLLLPCVIITAFLCASALPVHFMSYETTVTDIAENSSATVKQTQKHKEEAEESEKEYEGISDSDTLISCIAMVDPDSFTSPKTADINQLFKIAFWCVLRSDKEKNYDFALRQMTVSRKQTEKMYASLFPEADIPDPGDIDFGGVIFTYDKANKCYRVPVTGITFRYTAKTVKESRKGNRLVFETQYIPESKWTQNSKGTIIPPKAEKTMIITFKKNSNNSVSVCSVIKK